MSLTYFSDRTNVQLMESPHEWDEIMMRWDEKYPWSKKINKVVWRGRVTGYTYPDGERPRTKLIQYARNYLDIMDVKPSTEKSQMPQDDFQKYKAILDIDGNAWSARLGKLLCYNSVVIKVRRGKRLIRTIVLSLERMGQSCEFCTFPFINSNIPFLSYITTH